MSTSKKPMKRSVSSASLSYKGRNQAEVSKLSQVWQGVYQKVLLLDFLLSNSLSSHLLYVQTPINSFFTKAPKPAEPKSTLPESSGTSVEPQIPVKEALVTSAPSGGSAKISRKLKPRPKTIIIDDDDDDDVGEKRREKHLQGDSKGSNKNNTHLHLQQNPSAQRKPAVLTSVRHQHLIPFEERMPGRLSVLPCPHLTLCRDLCN